MSDYTHLIRKKKLTVRIREGISFIKRKINERGHEVQTIMFIPHDQKKIFNFHISNYTLLLSIAIFLAIIALAAVSVARAKPAEGDLQTLREETRQRRLLLKRYKDTVKNFEKEVKAYNESINTIYKISETDIPEDMEGGVVSKPSSVLEGFEYPEEALTLQRLKQELTRSRKHIENIKRLEQSRSALSYEIPSRWPVGTTRYIGQTTSPYGVRKSPFTGKKTFHNGVDIAAPKGTPIVATADGVVIFSGVRGAYGLTVMIRHKYGYRTLYAHNSRLAVRYGEKVKKGDIISYVGRTGRSTGNHLHYEVRFNGGRVDPWPYMTTTF